MDSCRGCLPEADGGKMVGESERESRELRERDAIQTETKGGNVHVHAIPNQVPCPKYFLTTNWALVARPSREVSTASHQDTTFIFFYPLSFNSS